MSYPTVAGRAVEGLLYREAQVCLGPAFANSFYLFFLSGTSTPANVYSNGTLTTAITPTGRVTADIFGRFPAIYLDPSVIYRVQFFNRLSVQQWQLDPYVSQLSTVGTSSLSAFGFQIAPTGEVSVPAPNTGGTGITLTLQAGALGSTPLQISSTLPGNSALIVNSSATTGAQTASFNATNKPGTATSSPAGWLPITCDGVQYYTPIWHGNPFSPYVANPTALGEVIVAQSVLFGGNGLTTATGGAATPSNWFTPVSANIGANFWINVTKTGGLSGLAFTAAQGAWTNIGAGGLTISSNAQSTITGTYQLSTSVTGSPVVASGTISLSNNNGVQSPTIVNGATPWGLNSNGTTSLGGVGVAQNWFLPTTTNIGASYWVSIVQTGGTPGFTFSVANGAWTNISLSGLGISAVGPGGTTFSITGVYSIASDAAGVNQLASGLLTLSGGTNVQSPNWSGTTPLVLAGNGAATLNGAGTSDWYSPNAANVGSGFWINITNTGGLNFTAAQGSWTNITNGGLTIDVSGTGTANGTWQISSSSSGTPVLGSGTISLNRAFVPATTTFTAAGANVIVIPSGSSSMTLEIEGGGGGGGGNTGVVAGNGGSSGARCVSTYSISPSNWGQTLTLTCGAVKASTGANNNTGQVGNDSTVVAGTFTGLTTMTAHGGGGGLPSLGGANAAGTATGGNVTNQTGNTDTARQVGAAGLTGTFINGLDGNSGANIGGGAPHPDTATTLGQGAVHFS